MSRTNSKPSAGVSLPVIPSRRGESAPRDPLIPLQYVPAPTQRLYVSVMYVGLWSWKIYKWNQMVDSSTESFWAFLESAFFDCVFLFGLPEFRIPWLELRQSTVLVLFVVHLGFDWMIMFNVGLPWQTWLFGFFRILYDRELAISEHNVKVSSILQNSSLITGRHIINILPEGFAVLNPDQQPYCIGGPHQTVEMPIYFNATVPVHVELVWTDLKSNKEEVVKLARNQLREIDRQAKRQAAHDEEETVMFPITVKKPGAYRLGKVLDEYKLEVQRKTQPTFVVPCPSAHFIPPSPVRCLGDLSDLSIQVDGTPPLKIHYSRTIDGKDQSFHFQSLQPDGFNSPLVIGTMPSDNEDVSWARPQPVKVSVNESMSTSGIWHYTVNEVQDGFGNAVQYSLGEEDQDLKPMPKHLAQAFVVKERPRMQLEGCDLRNPLRVARGKTKELPTRFEMAGRTADDTSHTVTWLFSPIDSLTKSGDHGEVVSVGTHHAKNARDHASISAPGLYTLKTVQASSCDGDIQEPAACLLLSPLQPEVRIRSEEIKDRCAGSGGGSAIGLRVDMDFLGTPPFVVQYEVVRAGSMVETKTVHVPGMRHQLDLIPHENGHQKYVFTTIRDAIYDRQKLHGPGFTLEQDVEAAPQATISPTMRTKSACLDEDVWIPVELSGKQPFTLEWELVRSNGNREHGIASDIEDKKYTIKTGPLTRGGEYTVAITKVDDQRKCPESPHAEAKISVRMQNPKGAFGLMDNKRKKMVVEDQEVKVPLRLTGVGPWTIYYRNLNESGQPEHAATLLNDNDVLKVKAKGIYEITDVADMQCRGSVDPKAAKFEVDWVARPELALMVVDSIANTGSKFVKADVCEGDMDAFEVRFKGNPPYAVEYKIEGTPVAGPLSMRQKKMETMNSKATIQMDTTRAGRYRYTFTSLADHLYFNREDKFQPLVLEQQVHAKPTASFVKPGQTFKYCMSDQDEGDKMPMTLTGVGPFALEIEIKHQNGAVPERFRIPSIESKSYGLQIPRQYLRLGSQQIRIRDIKDSRGCQSKAEPARIGPATTRPSVQIQLYNAPAIYPLETRTDICVGERLAYTLSGTPPFDVWYTFNGQTRKAKSPTTNFKRIAEAPGEFRIVSVADKASECRARVDVVTTIHPLPAVHVSKGRSVSVDIHEGNEVDILFEFEGTPPFEFTYTRSINLRPGKDKKGRAGQKGQVLETRHDVSLEHSKVVRTSQEGVYEVVAIKDAHCAYSPQMGSGGIARAIKGSGEAQKHFNALMP